MVVHIACDGTDYTFFDIGCQSTALDAAVDDLAVVAQPSDDSTYAHTGSRTGEGRALHAEAVDLTGDVAEDAQRAAVCYLSIADGMSATVVVAVESMYAGIAHRCVVRDPLEVDVCRLDEVETGALVAVLTVKGYLLQIVGSGDLVGFFLRTLSGEGIDAQWAVGIILSVGIDALAVLVEHRIGIGTGTRAQGLIPGDTRRCRTVVQQPGQFAAGLLAIIHDRTIGSTVVTIAGVSAGGETHV